MKSVAKKLDETSGIRSVPRAGRAARAWRPPGLVQQVRIAVRPKNRLALTLGALVGAAVPVASYEVAHAEVVLPPSLWDLWRQPCAWVVVACLVFSAPTVAQWGKLAFGGAYKGIALAVIFEVLMVTSRTPWVSLGALGYLVAINAVACGCRLAIGRENG